MTNVFILVQEMRGINRYIVGCKLELNIIILITSLWINRYIVGCKSIWLALAFIAEFGINRYIVGCKWISNKKDTCRITELIDT